VPRKFKTVDSAEILTQLLQNMLNISTILVEAEAHNFVRPKRRVCYLTACNANSVFMVPMPVAPDFMRHAIRVLHPYAYTVPFQNMNTSAILSTSNEGIRKVAMELNWLERLSVGFHSDLPSHENVICRENKNQNACLLALC
jgi:hypothetical protein